MKVVIIGAGMAGILMGIRLQAAGYTDFTIVEKAGKVGGTWRDNHYPGLHCDVPSHHYCYSFEPWAGWSETFSSGPEIREYLERVAVKYEIMPRIKFNAGAEDARWDGAAWHVRLATGEVLEADILVSATGGLRIPMYPNIKGLESFAGATFHTTQWDHGIDYADKKVGMIGTGSTAVQVTCALSGKVKKLSLFQRTAQWVMLLPNPAYSWWDRLKFRLFPERMTQLYKDIEVATSRQTGGAIMGLDPEARAELIANVKANLEEVRDPVLRAKLTPNFEVGCKRLVMSPSFFDAVQDPTVDLVTDGIDHIAPKGIVTTDGKLHELDVLVLATGFDPSAYIHPRRAVGRAADRLSFDGGARDAELLHDRGAVQPVRQSLADPRRRMAGRLYHAVRRPDPRAPHRHVAAGRRHRLPDQGLSRGSQDHDLGDRRLHQLVSGRRGRPYHLSLFSRSLPRRGEEAAQPGGL
jgi:cation diffusion facilitator CzcD-associated flavoprotein CzcO